ncbi:C4-dicarboxylate ABC transporter [Streptomyces sp. ODS28]|uniref:SLAC1 family transporter n=1 Tax=Streptomyces sp. ODS28 TaxID=3136688 RepID=UPI0031E8FBC6
MTTAAPSASGPSASAPPTSSTSRTDASSAPLPRGLPRLSVRDLGPNWYAAVMGTAILATGGSALPLPIPAPVLTAVWALSAALLAVLGAARTAHWFRHTDRAREHLLDPAVAPFYGCLAMAELAVGGAASAVGVPGAVVIDAVLWALGTATGVLAATAVPFLMVARHRVEPGTASPVWLLPVVAPMVSAAVGAPLIPHLPAGQARLAMELGCLALFGMSLLATLLVLPPVFTSLVHNGPPATALTPTLFLVLGPLGQSTTALGNLADAAPGTFASASVLYGVPVLGFALLWLALAAALVVRARAQGMRFAMTWWAFTFPIGTCVTGAATLGRHTGLEALGWLAVLLYALLAVAWLSAAAGTVRGLFSGALLAAPRTAAAARS